MLKVQRSASLDPKLQGFLYQVDAVEAVKDMDYAAIFHEQGLGKTKIGLDLALLWLKDDVVDSVLIVTKKGLVQNWRDEIAAHSFLTPRILDQDRSANFYALNSPARVYLTHYEVLKSEQKRLALFLKTRRVAAFLDEAHKIKNPDSDITQALLRLSPDFRKRIIMTGTPIANRPYDLWSQIRFLDQGAALGQDFSSFRHSLDLSNDFAHDHQAARAFEDALEKVFEQIRPFSVRQTKATSGIILPDKHVSNVLVELESRQAEIYNTFRDELSAVVIQAGRPILDDAEEMLKRLLRLVQVASNPALVDQSYKAEPGKLPILNSLLGDAIDAGSKAIVWTSFTENADWLARRLEPFGAVRVHGKRRFADRSSALTTFKNDPECRVLVATPGAAKEGLTLTVANYAVFYDRSFSLDDYLQAQDRIHRISQGKSCFVYNLIARDTIDEWVDRLLAAKHLAAQLGQGDISREQYQERATYEFGQMIRDVLRLDRRQSAA
jgi:SNF2 family DNA or RNA helicase